jgi:ribonucleoside-diphosphate reductase alpha chain
MKMAMIQNEPNELGMYVIKRNGDKESLSYDKIMERTKKLGDRFGFQVDYPFLITKVMDQLYNNIKTSQIDELMCETSASLGTMDYDYYNLASTLSISNHQKKVSTRFLDNYELIYNNNEGYLSHEFMEIIRKYEPFFHSILDYERDYEIDFFGFKTLERYDL